MYSEFFGYQVNLIYAAIVVAFYDICHIVFESYNRVVLLIKYENTENGCLKDFSQFHCEAILVEISVYLLDLLFCIFLIRGAFKMQKIWVMAWILLSVYHLIDFALYFTPIYGYNIPLSAIDGLIWLDVGLSTLGLCFVIYFYEKLRQNDVEEVNRERLANVDDFHGVEFGA